MPKLVAPDLRDVPDGSGRHRWRGALDGAENLKLPRPRRSCPMDMQHPGSSTVQSSRHELHDGSGDQCILSAAFQNRQPVKVNQNPDTTPGRAASAMADDDSP